MKVCIVGKDLVNFVDQETGEVIDGMNLYYYAPKDEVEGFYAGKLWIKKGSMFYGKMVQVHTEKPFIADVTYDVQPGRRMKLVLVDISVLEASNFEELAILTA